MNNYPQGRYAHQARTRLDFLLKKEALPLVLSEFQESHNRKNLRNILLLWPTCPSALQISLRDEFKRDSSGVLRLSMVGEPTIEGYDAKAIVSRTRQTRSATASGNTEFSFKKENQRWVIENGAF